MPNWNSWTMPVTTPMAKLIGTACRRTGLAAPRSRPSWYRQHLHHRHQQGQPDGKRDEEKVVGDRDAELPARQQHLHRLVAFSPSPCTPGGTGTSFHPVSKP